VTTEYPKTAYLVTGAFQSEDKQFSRSYGAKGHFTRPPKIHFSEVWLTRQKIEPSIVCVCDKKIDHKTELSEQAGSYWRRQSTMRRHELFVESASCVLHTILKIAVLHNMYRRRRPHMENIDRYAIANEVLSSAIRVLQAAGFHEREILEMMAQAAKKRERAPLWLEQLQS
jgi:hypothetical protein